MQRVKNIDYDDDDLYSDGEEDGGGEGDTYTAEDRENFATLTPVVQAELEEAGFDATVAEIEEALWHYYWDVAKSVAYLKNTRTPRAPQAQQQKSAKKGVAKPLSKFDQAAQRSAENAVSKQWPLESSPQRWFANVPWSNISPDLEGTIVPVEPLRPPPKLLGGSSKLAKLAEERRKKAAASQSASSQANGVANSLDRLTLSKNVDENVPPPVRAETRKYPTRKQKEPTPPPREPTPPTEEPAEQLPDLRTIPSAFGQTLSGRRASSNQGKSVALSDILGSSTTENIFAGPSPDDVVFRAQQDNKAKLQARTDSLAKKTENMSMQSTPSQPKIKSRGLDVPKLWEEGRSKRKASMAFVVIGHVDHGKSTLMGRLLLDTGAVSQRDIDKYRKQATELGKASFALAWVMDTGPEERERGVTVDIAQFYFHTDKVDFTILDAPGHRDFVPNMIAGASMADVAVLVVDANQLDSGMKGQTREHVLLSRACGLKKIVVAVNKMDITAPEWNISVFDEVRDNISQFLSTVGYTHEDVIFIPCSGLSGQNVVEAPTDTAPWVSKNYPTLLQALESSVPPAISPETIKRPFRMQISDVFRGSITNPISVSGHIIAGNIQTGETIMTQPSGETGTIKSIQVADESKDYAVAGQICTLHLADIEPQHLRIGDLLCSVQHPAPVGKNFIVRLRALDVLLPQAVDVHVGRLSLAGRIAALISIVDAKGEVVRKKPRIVKDDQRASVKLVLEESAAFEVGEVVILRYAGSTVAVGRVVRVGG